MKTDDWALLFFCCSLILFGIGVLIAAWKLPLSRRRPKRRSRPKPPGSVPPPDGETHRYGPAEWSELWRQVHDETVLIRRVDQTELPRRVRSGRRRVR